MTTTTETTLAQIAKTHLRFDTLETCEHDDLDLHYAFNHRTAAVWNVKNALQAAYDAGRVAGTTDDDALADVLRDNLSPESVTSIAAHIRSASTNDPMTDQQVRWFAETLIKLLGGNTAYAEHMEELGL